MSTPAAPAPRKLTKQQEAKLEAAKILTRGSSVVHLCGSNGQYSKDHRRRVYYETWRYFDAAGNEYRKRFEIERGRDIYLIVPDKATNRELADLADQTLIGDAERYSVYSYKLMHPTRNTP